jgi:hypothetical protein
MKLVLLYILTFSFISNSLSAIADTHNSAVSCCAEVQPIEDCHSKSPSTSEQPQSEEHNSKTKHCSYNCSHTNLYTVFRSSMPILLDTYLIKISYYFLLKTSELSQIFRPPVLTPSV